MKYWRGYLIAAVMLIATWAMNQFASTHSKLVDMVYPYMTRLLQTNLAQWSSGVDFCLWQLLVLFGLVAFVASIVLMVIFQWNPLQWFGWVLAAVSTVVMLNMGMYGMNQHTLSIAQDVHLETSDYSVTSLEDAAEYYLQKATELAPQISRDGSGNPTTMEFATLAQDAAQGFETLIYEQEYAIFAGSLLPVKELGFAQLYGGATGKHFYLTGEAAVNPNVPGVGLPFAICEQMARRMSIGRDGDADFAAFLACTFHDDVKFQYSGYLMAFRECYNALASLETAGGKAALKRIESQLKGRVKSDLQTYNAFLGKNADSFTDDGVYLLVNWHIQTVVLPSEEQEKDQVVLFDPLDETDERLQDLLKPAE